MITIFRKTILKIETTHGMLFLNIISFITIRIRYFRLLYYSIIVHKNIFFNPENFQDQDSWFKNN